MKGYFLLIHEDAPYKNFELLGALGKEKIKINTAIRLRDVGINDSQVGKAGIVLPHGVLFRGNAEEFIRINLLKTKYIKGIISLPPNLFDDIEKIFDDDEDLRA